MPRAQQNKVFSTFVKGLITEAGPLTFPENASTDEENCDLFAKGNRRRRLGVDLEDNFNLSTLSVSIDDWRNYAISTSEWKTVGGDGNLNFLVLQLGATLYFYNLSIVPLSRGLKSFTIDLNDFKVSGAVQVERDVVQTTNGKGILFVSGSKIESFFLEYDNTVDTNPTKLDLSGNSYIGDLDDPVFGGLASAFDGNDNQIHTDAAMGRTDQALSYVGVDFGVGVTKIITEIKVFSSNTRGFAHGVSPQVGSIRVFGSNTVPSSATNGNLLGDTGDFIDIDSLQEKAFTITDRTPYRWIWAAINFTLQPGEKDVIGEVTIFEEVTNVNEVITSTQIDIDVRDFEGVSDGEENDAEPATLTDNHNYNLKNQGWVAPNDGGTNPITTYFTSQSKYPPNSKQWWTGKNATDDFDPPTLTKFMVGNTLAPKGHFVLKAFNKDRATASGITALAVESITNRPGAVAFFAGRVWWAGISGSSVNGNIYFNQILEGTTNVGRCYQINDPTSEDLNSLLSSDGGIIVIPEIGSVKKLFAMQGAIIIMADNGVWSISGPDGAFKATDFTVSKISSIGIDSPESVVDVEGAPVWWGKTGINTITQDDVTFKFSVTSLSKDTIQTFYEDIPLLSKESSVGNYDQISKKVSWLYRSTSPSDNRDRFRFDNILVLDTRLGAFIPGTISTFSSEPFYIGGSFSSSVVTSATENSNVIDGTDDVVDGTSSIIDADSIIPGTSTFIKHLVFKEGVSNVQWSFGGFLSTSFKDWFSVDDVGVDYLSFFETGDELMQDVQRDKQSTYIHVLFNRTETAYADTSYETWIRPSGCLMQAKWEWSDNSNSVKFSPKTQVYRFQRRINEIVLDGSDVVFDGISQLFVENTYVPSSGIDFDSGFPVTITKNKVRGQGKALRLRFESETGKDFDLLGWAINFSGATAI